MNRKNRFFRAICYMGNRGWVLGSEKNRQLHKKVRKSYSKILSATIFYSKICMQSARFICPLKPNENPIFAPNRASIMNGRPRFCRVYWLPKRLGERFYSKKFRMSAFPIVPKCRCIFHHVFPTLSENFACEVSGVRASVSQKVLLFVEFFGGNKVTKL